MKRMLFIYNPKAGKGEIRMSLSYILEEFSGNGYEVVVHPTAASKDATRVVQECGDNFDLIVCSGGDGTLDEVVTGMQTGRFSRPLGYIPAGSTNDYAQSLGIPKQMRNAARSIMNGSVFDCDLGRLNDSYFVYVAAFGAFVDVSYDTPQDTEQSTSLLGLAAELLFGRAPVSSAALTLTEKNGEHVLELDEEMWEQITDAELEVFIDDGGGYLDLGLDNVLAYDENDDLIDAWNGTWLTLNGHPVAVYPVSEEDEDGDGLYVTTKFIPALLNGERVNLLVEFNEETGENRVLGAEKPLPGGVLERGLTIPKKGDQIQPVCDYFTYDGAMEGCYQLGEAITVPEDGTLTIINRKITGGDRMLYTVRLTDIYQAHYWVPLLEAE